MVTVVGGGLAGSEAAWQLARLGVRVRLFEMRPNRMTPAHRTGLLGELICSNSLKSDDPLSAQGMLKAELRALDSLVMRAAERARLPGGKALVVDRRRFAEEITRALVEHPLVEVVREEVVEIPEGVVILAPGPLASEKLAEAVKAYVGGFLYFYDAISPIVSAESLNWEKLYYGDRHGREPKAYLNAPMSKREYEAFVSALLSAEVHVPHLEEDKRARYFEGCLPIEVMAARGPETLRYGPLRPSGLPDPRTGREPYAVVQLRPEDPEGKAFSLVGFQTQLRIKEQERVFRMIPGLERAEFLRYGAVHRNTYVDAPRVLLPTLQLNREPRVFLAGQFAGTEGYLEAAAGGLAAALGAWQLVRGKAPAAFPPETAIGALLSALTTPRKRHEPVPMLLTHFLGVPKGLRGTRRREFIAERAKRALLGFLRDLGLT